MASKFLPKKVWKRTPRLITLEPFEEVVTEIQENTTWTKESITEKLCSEKMLIRLDDKRFHIYRDCLG